MPLSRAAGQQGMSCTPLSSTCMLISTTLSVLDLWCTLAMLVTILRFPGTIAAFDNQTSHSAPSITSPQ